MGTSQIKIIEYGHLFTTGALMVGCAVAILMITARQAEQFSAAGAELSALSIALLRTRWLSLLLPLAFAAVVAFIKSRRAPPAVGLGVCYAFTLAGLLWTGLVVASGLQAMHQQIPLQ